MERIVGEMEEEEQAEGGDNAADSMEGGDDLNQEDKEDGSEDAAVEHAEVEAQVHRGERRGSRGGLCYDNLTYKGVIF